MTAHDQMRAMLDQLMGTGRNGKFLLYHFSEVIDEVFDPLWFTAITYLYGKGCVLLSKPIFPFSLLKPVEYVDV